MINILLEGFDIDERGKTVYATAFKSGAILVDNGNIKLLGDVKVFN